LILDEPMSGLDPAAIEQVLKIIVQQAGRDGTTVLFSSHQLADVEQIADHIAIVDRGRVVVDGALDDLRAEYRRIQVVSMAQLPMPSSSREASCERAARGECCPCSPAPQKPTSLPKRAH
jgi:ABC-2 type transport system ATP-binding protein